MNSSSGFSNSSSVLGSSTGFKKRNLLRPPSGVLSKKQEFLRSVDICQSEPVIASFLRCEVAAIEEEINLMDKDRKLRQGEGGLQKNYVVGLRKWLKENQSLSEKEEDDSKILKGMGMDNYESGFRKLWKIVGHLDLVVSKISELQIVHFLLYDEMYNDLGKDSKRSASLLGQISSHSYSPCSFQITQIILDRFKDIYAVCRSGSSSSQGGKPREDSREDKKNREQTNQLIAQLKTENSKLNAMLEQLSTRREQEKVRAVEKEKVKDNPSRQQISPSSSPCSFKELEDKYQEQMRFLNSEKSNAEYHVTQLKTKISSLETQLKVATELAATAPPPAAKSGSYEEALMEEMQKMKKGFEKKIGMLTEEFTSKERDIRRRELEYKGQNEKIRWEKSLLLKKFELIAK